MTSASQLSIVVKRQIQQECQKAGLSQNETEGCVAQTSQKVSAQLDKICQTAIQGSATSLNYCTQLLGSRLWYNIDHLKAILAGKIPNIEKALGNSHPGLEKMIQQEAKQYRPASATAVSPAFSQPVTQQCMTPMEEEHLRWLNQDRIRHRLPTLESDCRLVQAARKHSEDMAQKNYFAHLNRKGEDQNARIAVITDHFPSNGENIWMGENFLELGQLPRIPALAEEKFMASPGHCKNILMPSWTHVGIGIAIDERDDAIYVTQDFGIAKR